MTARSPAFWKYKSLTEMSGEEWESLCDGCGKCCLNKLEDEETGEIYYTRAACNLLDLETCRCGDYQARFRRVGDCLDLRRLTMTQFDWLPRTCAYRLLAEGEPLPDWHPLVSGNPNSVHEAGISVRSYAAHQATMSVDEMMEHVIEWNV